MKNNNSFFKNRNGLNIYYEVINENIEPETIVFLNGVMASTSSWANQYNVLKKMNYKIILHDFLGQLKSDNFEGSYTFLNHVEDVIELLDFLNVKKAHFIGTSYGGEVAMKLAANYPNYCKSISIIDSVSELDQELIDKVTEWKDLAKTLNGEVFFKGMMPSIYGETFITENKTFLNERAKAMNAIPDSYFFGQIALYNTFINDCYMTEELKNITCPTMVICGEVDFLKPMRFSKIIADNIKNSEYITIPDCGHVTIFEKPDELNSILLGFLTKISNKNN